MMSFLVAHGFDPGPTQRPKSAGALSGLLAAIPAGGMLFAFGTVEAMADRILRIDRWMALGVLALGFALAGALYGALLRRAANDRRGGWAYGLVFGLLLWVAAPVVILPVLGTGSIAAGRAGQGFLIAFILWGAMLGLIFPLVHRPMEAGLRDQLHHHGHGSVDAAASAPGTLLNRWRTTR